MREREVILVCGPPCAGKTTYVRQHASPHDIVCDQDQLGPAAMRKALRQIARMHVGRAWVIRCAPGPPRREQLAKQVGATRTILLVPSMPELIARAKHRPNVRRTIGAIYRWHQREATAAPLRVQHTRTW